MKPEQVGKKVIAENGEVAKVLSVQDCWSEKCSGLRLIVKWPDGQLTALCTSYLKLLPDGNFTIERMYDRVHRS